MPQKSSPKTKRDIRLTFLSKSSSKIVHFPIEALLFTGTGRDGEKLSIEFAVILVTSALPVSLPESLMTSKLSIWRARVPEVLWEGCDKSTVELGGAGVVRDVGMMGWTKKLQNRPKATPSVIRVPIFLFSFSVCIPCVWPPLFLALPPSSSVYLS